MNYNEYKNYFQSIAASHTGINDFIFDNGHEEVLSHLRSRVDYPVLWLDAYSNRLSDNKGDQVIGSKTGALVVMERPTGERYASAIEADCEQIVIDIITKIRQDWDAGNIHVQFSSFNYATIQPMFVDGLHGVRLEFVILDPVNLSYVSEKWT